MGIFPRYSESFCLDFGTSSPKIQDGRVKTLPYRKLPNRAPNSNLMFSGAMKRRCKSTAFYFYFSSSAISMSFATILLPASHSSQLPPQSQAG